MGAVAVGDHLYVCGGFDGLSSLDTVERFDPEENTWSMVSKMLLRSLMMMMLMMMMMMMM